MKRTIVVTVLAVLGTLGMAAGWHCFASAAVPAGAEQVALKPPAPPAATKK